MTTTRRGRKSYRREFRSVLVDSEVGKNQHDLHTENVDSPCQGEKCYFRSSVPSPSSSGVRFGSAHEWVYRRHATEAE
jgi:hypothetical protein